MVVTIKYGDTTFYTEGDHDDVCKAIVDGKPLDVWTHMYIREGKTVWDRQRITFFGDPDWISVEL
jgi:hypothetical protein